MLFWFALGCSEPSPSPVTEPQAISPTQEQTAPPITALSPAKHALLIVIDTLRADALAQAQTPNLDQIAQQGDAVERAWSAGTWTVPSVISMFTGMSVRQHGWDLPTGRLGNYPPVPDAPTLATVLQQQGFHTAGFYANPYLAEQLGFDRGFETWRRSSDAHIPDLFAQHVNAQWNETQRHFAYVHLIGPHSPLKPSAAAAQRWNIEETWLADERGLGIGAAKRNQQPGVRQAYADAYHAVIEDTDARIGQLLGALGEHREDTVVVVVSDHGEMLGEHDKVGHGTMVFEPLTHVPFLIDRGELPETLGTASIPAVLSAHLNVNHTWPTTADATLPLVSQREGLLAMSPDGIQKGIWMEENLSVYHLIDDPQENQPIDDDGTLDAARQQWESTIPPGTPDMDAVTLHPQTIEALQAMGYLQ